MTLRIGEVAERVGVTTRTIRYYEERGLLDRGERTKGAHRTYDEADVNPPAGLFAFFGTRQPPVTMATVMPARLDRRTVEGMSVGLMHPTGGKSVARLVEAGVAVPAGWVVRQDHARRGLVLRTAPDTDPADIVTWCVQAGTALCMVDMTGQWQAVVYLP